MFYGHRLCYMAIAHVLWPLNVFYGNRTCSMAIGHVLWSTEHVLWPKNMFFSHSACSMAIIWTMYSVIGSHVWSNSVRGVWGAEPPALAGWFGGPPAPPIDQIHRAKEHVR